MRVNETLNNDNNKNIYELKLDKGGVEEDDDVTELKVGFNFENAFSKYSKFGGVTGVFDGAHI